MVAPPFPAWAWLMFIGLVLVLLFLDLFVFHRNAREVPFGEAMWLSAFWIAVSLAFGGFVWFLAGADGTIAYVTAYLLEKSLSLDNVFVFSVIFTSFAVPREYRYHVLFYGVVGAIVFRAIFVLAGAALLSAFYWLVFVFGAFLIFTGLRMFRRDDGEGTDYRNNRVLQLFKHFMPVTDDYHGHQFFVSRAGKRCATPLLASLTQLRFRSKMLLLPNTTRGEHRCQRKVLSVHRVSGCGGERGNSSSAREQDDKPGCEEQARASPDKGIGGGLTCQPKRSGNE